jgi:antirestriction protein ArdC
MERKQAPGELQLGTKKDVYAIVTEQIIKKLEQGTVPWHQPWTNAGIPRNLISKRPYRGINVMLLSMLGYEHNLFLTYNQLQQLGGYVRKGEHGHTVVFWNYVEVSVKHPEVQEDENKRKVPYLRYYLVFNVAQCEGIPKWKLPTVAKTSFDPIPVCEQIVEKMPQRPLIKYEEHRAFYDPLRDYINMPAFSSFESAEAFYSTLMHELMHSTGHSTRVGRKDVLQMFEFNRLEEYSHEELVAEIGSCYLLSFAGITTQLDQSANYINGWLSKLQDDSKFIFSASTQAQKATDFILNLPSETEVNQKAKPDSSRAFSWMNSIAALPSYSLFQVISELSFCRLNSK